VHLPQNNVVETLCRIVIKNKISALFSNSPEFSTVQVILTFRKRMAKNGQKAILKSDDISSTYWIAEQM